MSVLIKGMEMPNDCNECCLQTRTEYGETLCGITGVRLAIGFDAVPFCGRAEDCPLVEVKTPHGDLIDVDAIDIYDADSEWNYYNDEYTAFSLTAIKAQPSVIPAEEGEYEYDEE